MRYTKVMYSLYCWSWVGFDSLSADGSRFESCVGDRQSWDFRRGIKNPSGRDLITASADKAMVIEPSAFSYALHLCRCLLTHLTPNNPPKLGRCNKN